MITINQRCDRSASNSSWPLTMNVITKKSPTTSTASTNNTSYLSMMTPHVTNNSSSSNNNSNSNNSKRRESSMGEDSVSRIGQRFLFSLPRKDRANEDLFDSIRRWKHPGAADCFVCLLNQIFRSDEQLSRKSTARARQREREREKEQRQPKQSKDVRHPFRIFAMFHLCTHDTSRSDQASKATCALYW